MATGTSFLEVIRDIDLLKYLSSRSISALVATCSSTRKRVQQLASAVATAGDGDIELLLRGNWPNLSRLIVRKAVVTPEGLLSIAENWPALSSISFLSANIKPTAMQHLATCARQGTKSWQGLESLMLADVKLSLPACLKLAVADWPSIKTIRLRKTGMSAPGLRSVVSASWTDTLESLDLSCNIMASAHFEQLFTDIHWRKLHCLNLSFNKIDEDAAAWLIQGQTPALAVLNLRCCDIKAEGMQQLVKAEWLMLQDINLSRNSFDAAAFTNLPESFWPYIQVLNLSDCELDIKGISLLKAVAWPYLQSLDLSRNKLHPDALFMLNKCEWPIRHLNISRTSMTCRGFQTFTQGLWPELETIDMSHNGIAQVFYEKLKREHLLGQHPNLGPHVLPSYWLHCAEGFITSLWPHIKALQLSDGSDAANNLV